MDMGRVDRPSEVSKECGVHRQIMLARSGGLMYWKDLGRLSRGDL
jgi:hypothetical protein